MAADQSRGREMNNGNVPRVFSTTLNNLKRLFKPDQQLEPKIEPEPEQVHVAARVANPWQDQLDQLVANRFQPKPRSVLSRQTMRSFLFGLRTYVVHQSDGGASAD